MNFPLTADLARDLYLRLLRCRKFEEKIIQHYAEKEMRCPTHLSVGQEGAAAGVCAAFTNSDVIFSTHRCHSHTIAKGGSLKALMAELHGKVTGCCRGKGGSMHFLDENVGAFGASAIVGGSVPLAAGAALAFQMRGQKHVAAAMFGDGALEQGTFHEAMSFAALKNLPMLFVAENNRLATCTWLSVRQPFGELYRHAASYGIPGVRVDGSDVVAVYAAAKTAVERARAGEGPTFLEITVERWREHVGPNFDTHLGFRTQEEIDRAMQTLCPIKNLRARALAEKILTAAALDAMEKQVEGEMEEAYQFAKASPFPDVSEIYTDVL